MNVERIVFRKLTVADYFNINKPPGTEDLGGGQSYIDIPTSAVSLANWRDFFSGIPERTGRKGPKWVFRIKSLGVTRTAQEIEISQRRPASVSIRSQKILSTQSKRVYAWHPDYTQFPKPANPTIRNDIDDLHIYIVRTDNGEYWAGWFQKNRPEPGWLTDAKLRKMFTENEGFLIFSGNLEFDDSNPEWPFGIRSTVITPVTTSVIEDDEVKQTEIFFEDDEIIAGDATPEIIEVVRKTRKRNTKAVKKLKELYNNLCQLTGSDKTFLKSNGEYYSEAHHLIPLGEGGADSVFNIVIVSPLIHRMLHYANVEDFDISQIDDNKLDIKINGETYTITWHSEHARIVEEFG